MLNFYGQASKQGVQLSWLTSNEMNNAYFEIERSYDGSEYFAIGKVKAAINNNGLNTYSFTDTALSIANNTPVYYRLVIVDLSGNETISNAIEVSPLVNTITTYPNPFTDQTTIVLNLNDQQSPVFIYINDIAGNLVQRLQVTSNVSKISVGEGLQNGVYLVQVNTDGSTYHFKIIKQ